ncbi:MAG: hypothetical protein A3D67_02190 [Candidatus Lloydbacteria bacterium RIFCSPHIGHO2_02_FULL_51_22]|uniref:Uncharacterized protein n=1 Tax=Candidatus Lloydbacteria bacterium RIFCSPHIGHO2_02_FULL_51_22 TaxID=1798663 RepID=A0A1G2DDV5_9BACT|nr:MAG: hypothetical protein A3D67_02190 [Candidatus Lloydbacteria bacterium RIFCSPHIGHO2_02_FULL_51_22]
MPSREQFLKDIGAHPAIVQNPYTSALKEGVVGRTEIADFLVQFSIFADVFLPRIYDGYMTEQALQDFLTQGLAEIASAVPIETMKVRNRALATRATEHAVHMLERPLSRSASQWRSAGARAALWTWLCHEGRSGDGYGNVWHELLLGFQKSNSWLGGVPSLPTGFFGANLMIARCAGKQCLAQVNKPSLTGGSHDEWTFRHNAHLALNAVHLFWTDLQTRRERIKAGALLDPPYQKFRNVEGS